MELQSESLPIKMEKDKIENIETKTYNLTVSFLGYKSQTKYNIIVKSVGTSDLLFKLSLHLKYWKK